MSTEPTMSLTTMLLSIAELSNIFSVFVVLICFCVMILFITRNMMILRVNGDDVVFSTNMHNVHTHRIPQMNMMKVHIPFTFNLVETSKSTYSDVQCLVSSQVKYTMRACWGVSIRELHIALWRPWKLLHQAALDGNLLTGHYQLCSEHKSNDAHTNKIIRVSLPNDSTLELGTPPRLSYPLVIFLFRTDDPATLHPDDTVALVNIVHIKDSVCTLPTSILAQYLKQANGQLSCLKQLYLATGNPNFDDEMQLATTIDQHAGLALAEPMTCGTVPADDTDNLSTSTLLCSATTAPNAMKDAVWNAAGEQLCVVCQYFPLSRALLPCRHTCICANCFSKLERCPMCRSPIKSFFCIRGEEYMSSVEPRASAKGDALEPASPLFNWLESWNDRLTDFLGFGR